MALLFCDGFDHYTSWNRKWNTKGGTEANVSIVSGGRNASCMRLYARTDVTKVFGPPASKVYCGAAFKFEDTDFGFLYLKYLGAQSVYLYLNTDNTIKVVNAAGTTLGISSSGLNLYIWNYIEFGMEISSTGSYVLKVNGDVWLSGSADLTAGGLTEVNDITLSHNQPSNSVYVDDLYVCDESGSVANDFLGDVTVELLLPSGSGAYSGWTASPGGSPNYAHVDEEPPDDDTSYVSASTSGTRDSYIFSDLSVTNASIFGLAVWGLAKKDVSGGAALKAFALQSGSFAYTGSAAVGPETYDYRGFILQRDEKPGGGQWEVADVNNSEFGVEVV